MEILIIISVIIGWYVLGYVSFIISLIVQYQSVDDEDVRVGFFFALLGPLLSIFMLIIYFFGLLIMSIDSERIADWINDVIYKFKK